MQHYSVDTHSHDVHLQNELVIERDDVTEHRGVRVTDISRKSCLQENQENPIYKMCINIKYSTLKTILA